MQVFENKINIDGLRNCLNAAESLQLAGETAQARAALKTLADNIIAQLPKDS